MALTAYNHGANGIARAVRDVGSNDIGRIIEEYKGPRFGFASRNFYPQFLAALHVDRNYEDYYGPIQLDSHPGFYAEEMGSFVSVDDLANSLNVSVAELQRDNPALQPSVWSGTKRIPKGYSIKVRRDELAGGDLLASLNSLPLSTLFSEQIPDLSYVVRRGDSLSVIAERYRTTISELVAINQLRDRNTIRIGQQILLPQQDGSIPTLVINDGAPLEVPANGLYEVRRGDTLSIIAERYQVSVGSLVALNSLSNESMIFPGQSLRLQSTEVPDQTTAMNVIADLTESSPVNIEADDEEIDSIVGAELDATLAAVEATVMLEENEAQLLVDLSADPADYGVARDGSIEIQAIETLGHYADWLGIRTQRLRNLNGLAYRDPVMIGGRLKLDFSEVDQATFESRRRQFHRDLQQQYFTTYRIQQTEEYSIQRRDFLEASDSDSALCLCGCSGNITRK